MPELPEVETVCRALRRSLCGRTVSAVRVLERRLRTPVEAVALAGLVGRGIVDVRRRGKFLVIEFGGQTALLCHLGMTGTFRTCPGGGPPEPHDCVEWCFAEGEALRFRDVRRFGSVEVVPLVAPGAWPDRLADLGPEPLGPEFDGSYLFAATRRRSQPVKSLLLDQRVVAGIGNIYASEALYRAGVHPARRSQSLSRLRCSHVAEAVRVTLAGAVAAGGTTVADFRSVDGTEGLFVRQLAVYGRAGEACVRCGSRRVIRRTVQAGRSTFFCPGCQR